MILAYILTSNLENVKSLLEYTPVLEGESPAVQPKLPRKNRKIIAIILDNIQKI
jgi:hypothetical protein